MPLIAVALSGQWYNILRYRVQKKARYLSHYSDYMKAENFNFSTALTDSGAQPAPYLIYYIGALFPVVRRGGGMRQARTFS
jgi:hypothetical protein